MRSRCSKASTTSARRSRITLSITRTTTGSDASGSRCGNSARTTLGSSICRCVGASLRQRPTDVSQDCEIDTHTTPVVSVVVVTYGTGPIVLDCLDAIAAYTAVSHEVIVVDNPPNNG